MVDEEKDLSAEESETAEEESEEVLEPQSKYERIMVAAAEAARLNEEMRRKGIQIEGKITLEALRRVREGKVKAVVRKGPPPRRHELAMPVDQMQDSIFLTRPPVKEETQGEDETPAEPASKDEE